MSLTIAEVKRVAELAHIKMQEEELDKHHKQLNRIMGWIEQLNEVNTDGVAPWTSVHEQKMLLRSDVVTEGNNQEALMKVAPAQKYGYFVVPKVIE